MYIVDDAIKSLRLKVALKKIILTSQTSKTEPKNIIILYELIIRAFLAKKSHQFDLLKFFRKIQIKNYLRAEKMFLHVNRHFLQLSKRNTHFPREFPFVENHLPGHRLNWKQPEPPIYHLRQSLLQP